MQHLWTGCFYLQAIAKLYYNASRDLRIDSSHSATVEIIHYTAVIQWVRNY